MPSDLTAKVFWLATGINDLISGFCSEEVVVLGTLRLADEIYFHHSESIIVIQGILPWSRNPDGSLDDFSHRTGGLGHHPHHPSKVYSVDKAKRRFSLWPSIQRINQELEKFCAVHDHLVYFDVDDLFLGTMGNKHYKSKQKHILTDLLIGGQKLSYEGYTVLGNAIKTELERIIYDEDETNDVETSPGGK
jgi:hypothetical protein